MTSQEQTTGRRPWRVALATVFLLGLALAFVRTVNLDVAWFLYVGEGILDGKTLYRDILETNPPLVVFWTVPPVWVARALGCSSIWTFNVYMLGHIALSFVMCRRATRVLFAPDAAGSRRFFELAVAWVLWVAWPGDSNAFGQREHLFFMLTLPYFLSTAARAAGHRPTGCARWLTAVMGGIGFMLKPYFLLPWVANEAWLAWVTRTPRSLYRSENLVVAGIGVVYAAMVFLLCPQYIELVPILMATYPAFEMPLLWILLTRAVLVFALLAVPVAIAAGRGRPYAHLRGVLAAVTFGMLAAALVQMKGFASHVVPTSGTVVLLLVATVSALFAAPGAVVAHLNRRLVRNMALVAFAALCLMEVRSSVLVRTHDNWSDFARLVKLTRAEAAGEPIAGLSTAPDPGFPLVNYTDTTWGTRFSMLWPLPACYADAPRDADGNTVYHRRDEMNETERWVFDAVIEDLERSRPKLILVECTHTKLGFLFVPFDFVAYFSTDARFRKLWTRYRYLDRFIGDYHTVEVYRRID